MTIAFKKHDEYGKLLYLGEENRQLPDKLGAFFLALSPILQHYKGAFEDAGITVLVLFLPWLALRVVHRLRWRSQFRTPQINIIIGLLFFLGYRSFVHGVSVFNLIYNLVMMAYFIGAALGCVNVKAYIKTAANVAAVACGLIIIQYFCYYLLGFHLQLVPTSLLLPEAHQWVLGAQTGLAGITGVIGHLYRPSAFFLEPSHMFLYTFPHLFIVLFAPNINRPRIQRAVLYSVGLLFSTSGMGIATVLGAWVAYFALTSGKANNLTLKSLLKAKNFSILLVLLLVAVILFSTVPMLRESVMRVLDDSNSGAIAGRTRRANVLIRTLSGTSLLFGVTNTLEGIEFNMPGALATLYKFGIIGVALSYWAYLIGVFRLKQQYFWISLLIVITSFFSAQTHGTFYMMYYVYIILEGNYAQLR